MAEKIPSPEFTRPSAEELEREKELRGLIKNYIQKHGAATMDLIFQLAHQLETDHPDIRQYWLFHTLIGSTPVLDGQESGFAIKGFDLPDGTIEKIIRENFKLD